MPHDSSIQIIRSMRRSISIKINPDGSVVVHAPVFMSMGAIHSFIDDKQDWIDKHQKKIVSRPKIVKKQYQQGEEFLYLGNKVVLTIGKYSEIHVQGDKLFFPEFLQFRIKTELEKWFVARAKEIITDRLKANAATMNVSYKSLTFSDTSSKWGSCTHDNRLQFCWRLIMSPILVINYVVIHELSHTIEKNHSEDFWTIVRKYNPSYKQQIKWLKIHGETLTL